LQQLLQERLVQIKVAIEHLMLHIQAVGHAHAWTRSQQGMQSAAVIEVEPSSQESVCVCRPLRG
jgi:hypothetical protein